LKRWRWCVAAVLLAVCGVPLAMPFLDLFDHAGAWRSLEETGRLASLARNTLLLVAGTLALALPTGVVGAILLYRSDLPGRRWLRVAVLMTLFVPLPVFASAWQVALGARGWFQLAAWATPPPGDPDLQATGIAWKPWAQGLPAAIWVHAVAGLPWVVWLVGQGLRWVERELEEDALTVAGPWRVLFWVTLPRARAAILAAGLWVALQTATEITVTDLMQVRTFAEEVYSQFTRPDADRTGSLGDGLARSVAVSIPAVLVTGGLVALAAVRWQRSLPPLESLGPVRCLLPLGRWRWPCLSVVFLVGVVLVGVPVGSLVWKVGLGGSPEGWSVDRSITRLAHVLQTQGGMLLASLAVSLMAGTLAAGLALLCAWLAAGSGRFYALVLLVAVAAWALPAPVVGLGLKDTINRLMDAEDALSGPGAMRSVLYDGPSLLPLIWISFLRYFPCALAILWPTVRLLPRELIEAARVDGARPATELVAVVGPLCFAATVRAGLAVAVLSLGELGGGKLVETPGSQTFAHAVFEQMHYGVPGDVAALCLVLLAAVALGALTLGWLTAERE
jgi:iron(III) transport system permease protein